MADPEAAAADEENPEASVKFDIDIEFVRERAAPFEKLFANFPRAIGQAVSKKERDEKGNEDQALAYGEISFEMFGICLRKIQEKYSGLVRKGGRFYDLGCGIGKPLFAAASLHAWDEVAGVEVLEGLHNLSKELLRMWNEQVKGMLPKPQQKINFKLVHGDAANPTALPWHEGDLVFIHSTLFDEELMKRIAAVAERMEQNSFVVTFTKPLPSACFDVLEEYQAVLHWGVGNVYIHKRNDKPEGFVPEPEEEDF